MQRSSPAHGSRHLLDLKGLVLIEVAIIIIIIRFVELPPGGDPKSVGEDLFVTDLEVWIVIMLFRSIGPFSCSIRLVFAFGFFASAEVSSFYFLAELFEAVDGLSFFV